MTSKTGTIFEATEDLLRARRGGVISRALDPAWRSDKPLDLSDIDNQNLEFLIRFISVHPADVNWKLPSISRQSMLVIADEYLFDDLKSELED